MSEREWPWAEFPEDSSTWEACVKERDRYKAALEHELECCKCYTIPGECPMCKRIEEALK